MSLWKLSFVTGGGHQTLAFRPATGSWWVGAAGTVHQLSDFILSHWMANYSDIWRVSPVTQTDILMPYSFELPSSAGDSVYSQTLPTPNSPILPFFYLQQPFPLLCFSFLVNLLSYSILTFLSLSHSAFKASSLLIPLFLLFIFYNLLPETSLACSLAASPRATKPQEPVQKKQKSWSCL